jgi:hypothetical protein
MLVVSQSDAPLTNIDRQAEISELAKKFDASSSLAMIQALQSSLEALEVNANLRLLTDTLMLSLPRL